MIVLGIDTSCDDTGISAIEVKGKKIKVLANLISSQTKLHEKYGGVFPTLAKREHQKNLPILFNKISNLKFELLAITVGPGLEPCLWQGINFAKNLAKNLLIPVVPVNHIEAHILINLFDPKRETLKKIDYPAICLVASGGHTQLILMEKIGKYKILGETRDDAAGECFDKVARLLEIGYPGGPAIEKYSRLKTSNFKFQIKLPRPMIFQKNYDFSFAGLKTAVLYDFRKRTEKEKESKDYKIEMAKEVQEAVFEVLISKTLRAAKKFNAKTIILGGGVGANQKLRKDFKKNLGKIKFLVPRAELCTDNGLMVALCGYLRKEMATKDYDKIKAEANLRI